jgi:membrane fusion protein (multidrug efflux system)
MSANVTLSMKPAVAAAIALTMLGSGACSKKEAPQPEPPKVTVVEVTPTSVPVYDEFVGQTDAPTNVEIRARVEGYVDRIAFEEGSIVRQGAVLYVLDRRPYEAALENAKATRMKGLAQLAKARESVELLRAKSNLEASEAELVNAEQNLARVRPLAAEKAVTQAQLDAAVARQKEAKAKRDADASAVTQAEITQRTDIDAAKAIVDAADADIKTATLNLGYTTVTAPISGRIGRSSVKVGSLVQLSMAEPLTTISTTDEVYVNFSIPERLYIQYSENATGAAAGNRPGQNLELILADGQVYPHRGRVNLADRQVDPETGTLGLRAVFPNPAGTVKPGQFARVRAVMQQVDNAVVIPQEAIQDLLGTRYVYVVRTDNMVERRDVVPGSRVGSYWVIDQGLGFGDRVVVEGVQNCRPNLAVTPLTKPNAAPSPEGLAPAS